MSDPDRLAPHATLGREMRAKIVTVHGGDGAAGADGVNPGEDFWA